MLGSAPIPKTLRRLTLVGAVTVTGAWMLIAAGPLGAESFPPMPPGSESRCAPVAISAHLVSVGAKIEATAGPSTASCGGASSTVHWAWPVIDRSTDQAPGLIETHPCPADSTHCEFKARLFTQAGLWNGICITGSSPDGGWGSCQDYAVRFGPYRLLAGSIPEYSGGRALTIHLSGPGGPQHVAINENGSFQFAVKRGRYKVSVRAHHKTFRHTVRVAGKPGSSVSFTLQI